MDYKILKFQLEDSIGIITISRPEALNALNNLFFDELNSMLEELDSIKELKALIITGEGKAFVAGADIAEMVGMNSDQACDFSVKGQDTFFRLEDAPFPVIAAVNGFALGGGCELAMACDFRIASSKAKFGQPEVNLGLIPGFGGTQRLSRLVGLADALYLLTTAETIDAQEALRIKLVQKVVEPELLLDEAKRIAKLIASKGPEAVRLVKAVTRQGYDEPMEDACDIEANEFGTLFGNEGTEGMNAFLEKRKPEWK